MIERNTTDLTTPGYDDRTGWGRINAGEVFRNISFPEFRIEHYQFAVKLENATLDGPQELLCLEQSLFGLPVGPTNARRWKITGSASHSLPPGYTLLGGWPRGSGCRNVTGIRSVPFSNVVCGGSMPDSFLPSELNADLDVFTDNSATMSGYFYEILDESLNHVGWWPTDPSDIAGFAYTLYLIDLSVNTEEADDKSSYLTIYPNPANSSITVNVENPGGTKSILITNVSGQTLKEIRDTRNTSITIDISGFPAGAYFVSTKSDQHQEIKKIIIQ